MTNAKINWIYCSSCIIIILVLLLIIQYNTKKNVKHSSSLVVDTQRGLIKVDKNKVIDRLTNIYDRINIGKTNVTDNSTSLNELIDDAIYNSNTFIKCSNGRLLANLDIKNNIINLIKNDPTYNTKMDAHSITNDRIDIRSDIDELYNSEEHSNEQYNNEEPNEHTTINKLNVLLKNIKISIELLNEGICEKGRIDIYLLEKIANSLDSSGINYTQSTYVPFRFSHSLVEPFDSSRNTIIQHPKIESKYANLEDIRRATELIKRVNYDEIYRSNTDVESQYLEKEFRYGDIKYDEPSYQNGLEGTVMKDLLEHKPPGYFIGLLDGKDREEYYTTRIHACGGRTVSDDKLWSECAVTDVKLLNAVNGNPFGLMTDIPQ